MFGLFVRSFAPGLLGVVDGRVLRKLLWFVAPGMRRVLAIDRCGEQEGVEFRGRICLLLLMMMIECLHAQLVLFFAWRILQTLNAALGLVACVALIAHDETVG